MLDDLTWRDIIKQKGGGTCTATPCGKAHDDGGDIIHGMFNKDTTNRIMLTDEPPEASGSTTGHAHGYKFIQNKITSSNC